MGREDLLADPAYRTSRDRNQHKEHLNGLISEWMGRRTVKEISEEYERQGVAYAPVQTIAQASMDPQLRHRGTFGTTLEIGSRAVPAFRSPPHFSQMPPVPLVPPSSPGQHNQEVFGDHLGFDAERLDALRNQGVI
jgi:formyl-CoA transferase